jgi:hypothetical protein
MNASRNSRGWLILFSLDHVSLPRILTLAVAASGVVAADVSVAFNGPGYTPAIFNASDGPIRVVERFADDSSSPASLPTDAAAWQRIRGRQLVSLEVVSAAQKHTYGLAQLDQLRRDHPVRGELWVIDNHGITLHESRDIDTLRKRLARTHQ